MAANVNRHVTCNIRDVCFSDITALSASIPEANKTFSIEWLISQQTTGKLDYIAAWINEIPVGQGVILWNGYVIPELAAEFPDTPVIRSVEVIKQYRGQGIGSAIVGELETRANARGFAFTSLGVTPENTHAGNLWRHLGYRDWEKGIVAVISTYERPSGEKLILRERFTPMRKQLI